MSTGRDPGRGYPGRPGDLDVPQVDALLAAWTRRRYAAVIATDIASSWRRAAHDSVVLAPDHPQLPEPVEHTVAWVRGSMVSDGRSADPATVLNRLSASSDRVEVRCAEPGATGPLLDDPLLIDDAVSQGVALLLHSRSARAEDPARTGPSEVVYLVPQRLHEGLLTWHAYRGTSSVDYVGPGSGVGVKDCLRRLREQILHAEAAIDVLGHRGQSTQLRALVDAISRDWLSESSLRVWDRERAGALELAIPMIVMADAALIAPSPAVSTTDEARRRHAITEVRKAAIDVFQVALQWDRE